MEKMWAEGNILAEINTHNFKIKTMKENIQSTIKVVWKKKTNQNSEFH